MQTISYIIGYRFTDINDRRTENLKLTIKWLVELKKQLSEQSKINLQIIIIEQANSPKFSVDDNLKDYIQYLFIYNAGYYNRGFAFNVGFKQFNADYYFFADGDILLNCKSMIHVFNTCFDYEAVNPYNHIYDSDESYVTDKYFNPIVWNDNISNLFSERKDTCFTGGIMGISRHAMNNISGWDERFRGRGYEDYAFTAKINLFLYSCYTYPYSALHLWHPYEVNTTREINEKINSEYAEYTFYDYVNLIESNHAIGNPLKYATYPQINNDEKYRLSDSRYKLGKKRYNNAQKKGKSTVYLILGGQSHNLNNINACAPESGGKSRK